ncbi:MAG: sugar-binding transcriptional regulator [Rhodospirillales bacterium]
MSKNSGNFRNRLDEAARAGWLYYVAHNTQDEIAEKMNVSRQSAQRLVALALRERLIKFKLDHPIARCMDLSDQLRRAYGLSYCEVTPSDPASDDPALGIAEAAAAEMDRLFMSDQPMVMALGTGLEIRGAVEQMAPCDRPCHKVVSLVGNLAPDGSSSFNDVIMRIGDTTRAPHYPMAVPVVATSRKERDTLCAQKPIQSNIALAHAADVAFIGIGEINDAPPLLTDGFITPEELHALKAGGAAGEIVGWAYDAQGKLLECAHNNRVASVPLRQPPRCPTIGVARGPAKLPAVRAALLGRWVSGLITDEATAEALAADPPKA